VPSASRPRRDRSTDRGHKPPLELRISGESGTQRYTDQALHNGAVTTPLRAAQERTQHLVDVASPGANKLRPRFVGCYLADDIAYCRRCLAPSAMSADRYATLLVGVGERAGSLPQSKHQRIWIPGLRGCQADALTSACPHPWNCGIAQKCVPTLLALFNESTDCLATVNVFPPGMAFRVTPCRQPQSTLACSRAREPRASREHNRVPLDSRPR
jgi:hypothetical protein